MALISWKQISTDLLQYGKLTGSLEVEPEPAVEVNVLEVQEVELNVVVQ